MRGSIKHTLMLVCHAKEERLKITMLSMILQLQNVNKLINVVLSVIMKATKETNECVYLMNGLSF